MLPRSFFFTRHAFYMLSYSKSINLHCNKYFGVLTLGEKQEYGKVYEFKPRKGPKLKSVKYVSPEKKQMIKEREQAKKDKKNFYIGVGALLVIVAVITFLRLK